MFRYYYQSGPPPVAAGADGYVDNVLNLSPDGFWTLQDASGNFADSTSNSYDATVTGSPTYGNTGPTIDSEGHDAIGFSGTDQYGVASEAVDDGVTTSTGMTLSFWYKTTSASQNPVAKNSGSNTATWVIYCDSSGHIGLQSWQTDGSSAHGYIETTSTYHDGNWHHVVAWIDSSQYLHVTVDNSETVDDTTVTGTWNAESDATFSIGATGVGSGDFTGDIALVAFWRSVLTSGQRASLYTGSF